MCKCCLNKLNPIALLALGIICHSISVKIPRVYSRHSHPTSLSISIIEYSYAWYYWGGTFGSLRSLILNCLCPLLWESHRPHIGAPQISTCYFIPPTETRAIPCWTAQLNMGVKNPEVEAAASPTPAEAVLPLSLLKSASFPPPPQDHQPVLLEGHLSILSALGHSADCHSLSMGSIFSLCAVNMLYGDIYNKFTFKTVNLSYSPEHFYLLEPT